ncbi:Sperm-associated antigen 17-like [Oopsacas minuta]|uniref:Sperm-associated antigen 17-like n=1 Tax=Oopsacas minuta TaxID=111878 RepID=A0AAV7JM01_9METZ|nr:Sperm-associated antigen 17-like [Oopsacas minuta]
MNNTLRPGDRECIDETKRQLNTASLSMPLSKNLKQGISLLETEVDFGMLEEGCNYSYTVIIKNTGIRSTRYKIKPPPPSTGIKIIYTPHPIAAGMSSSFQIEVYAVPVGVMGEIGQGHVEHNLEIISEINTLILPVTATVLTTASYQDEVADHTLIKGVSLLSREHKH